MSNIYTKGTLKTPEVKLNNNGELSLYGVSMGETVENFYKPIFEWVDVFSLTNPERINLILSFEYLNTPSVHLIVKLINKISLFKKAGTNINITWQYEEDDESIFELGEDIEISSKSKFTFEPVNTVS